MFRKVFLLAIFALVAATSAKAEPLFPIFVDIVGDYNDIDRPTFLQNVNNRACDYYSVVGSYYKNNPERVFSFLKDVLPDRVLNGVTETKTDEWTLYVYSDPMLDGVVSYLTVIVYSDGSVAAEYVEGKPINQP